jgi:hypothetical protein
MQPDLPVTMPSPGSATSADSLPQPLTPTVSPVESPAVPGLAGDWLPALPADPSHVRPRHLQEAGGERRWSLLARRPRSIPKPWWRRLFRRPGPGRLHDAGMATAEYAVATLAAVGFAALLLAILRSSEVRGLLLGIIRQALAVR